MNIATKRWLPHTISAAALLVLLYPLAWLLATSLKPADEVMTSLDLWPSRLEWSNYTTALDGVSGVTVTHLLGNTLLIAGVPSSATSCPARWPPTPSPGCASG
ncbi:hypothetical protein SANT12839_001430 [Streptomyces antimycoticus]|uniref:ABC transmembrane type-1 domain-containing protein n=1 Tax=Streptomyces antimycoticus TaxID=68175 RepID=A0A4D4JRA7_9ACTN|nr:hypothetical protein SANT12839_001430 [Streptomyces antimycoticus]